LILKLYDLRREHTMREARGWFARSFNPTTVEDVLDAVGGSNSAFFRMATSYWDMAAALVLNGAIDEQMFNDANGEHVVVFAKLEPYLAEYRARSGNPMYLAHLEKLVMSVPDAKERLAWLRDRFKRMAAQAASPRP
jgi:hypothetical protein